MAPLMECWQSGFRAELPTAEIEYEAGLSADGAREILQRRAHLAPFARELFPSEKAAFDEAFGMRPPMIAVAGGSFASRGKTHAIAIYVNEQNPVESLTWAELHRVFAANESLTWGDLGLEGDWSDKPVKTYGMPNLRDTGNPPGIANYMRIAVNAGAPLNDSIRQLAGDGETHALQQIVDAVAADIGGIGYSGFDFAVPGARSVPLEYEGGPITATPELVRSFDYLLSRRIYIAVAPQLEHGSFDVAIEFVRFVLSTAGQSCVDAGSSGFTVLPSNELHRQRSRVEYLSVAGPDISKPTYLTQDGKVRVVGYNDMDEILGGLNERFCRTFPAAEFDMQLTGTRDAPLALAQGRSAFGPMGAEFSEPQLEQFRRATGRDPVAIRVAHASLSPKAMSGPLAIFVNDENPLAAISLAQLRRAFNQTEKERQISTWRELGVGGELEDEEIQACGLAPHTALATYFRRYVLANSNQSDEVQGFGQSSDVVDFAANNRNALCFAAYIRNSPEVRAIAVSETDESPAYPISRENILENRYPLDRFLYVYLRQPVIRDADPILYDYLQLVLSPAGQGVIADGTKGYIPLNNRELVSERKKVFDPPIEVRQ